MVNSKGLATVGSIKRRVNRTFEGKISHEELLEYLSDQIIKKLERLKTNPENTGKPLLYTKPTLWQFKVEMFRVFYIMQKNIGEVWLLSIKHKNETDNYIKGGYSKDINEF